MAIACPCPSFCARELKKQDIYGIRHNPLNFPLRVADNFLGATSRTVYKNKHGDGKVFQVKKISASLETLNAVNSLINEGDELTTLTLRAEELTAEGFAPFGQVVAPTEDGTKFGPDDAQLHLQQGIPRLVSLFMTLHSKALTLVLSIMKGLRDATS